MTEQEAISLLKIMRTFNNGSNARVEAIDTAINALEKQKELRENCEGSCLDCKYRGEFHCANDLLIDIGDSEV